MGLALIGLLLLIIAIALFRNWSRRWDASEACERAGVPISAVGWAVQVWLLIAVAIIAGIAIAFILGPGNLREFFEALVGLL